MFGRQGTRAKRRVMEALTVSVVALLATSPALAAIAIAANDLVARVSDDGRHVVLGGVLLCDEAGAGDKVKVYVTVTQRQGVTHRSDGSRFNAGTTRLVSRAGRSATGRRAIPVRPPRGIDVRL